MRFKNYLQEGKLGKLPSRIEKKAYMKDFPAMLQWTLINPDERETYKTIEAMAWKELTTMKNKKLLDFYEDDFDVTKTLGIAKEIEYEATVKLQRYHKNLHMWLKKLGFKVFK